MGNKSIPNYNDYLLPKIYFTEFINNKIQLNISIDKCELNNEYHCEIFLNSLNEENIKDKTERKNCTENNQKIIFSNSKPIEFNFKKPVKLYIKIFKNEKISIIETTTSQILTNDNLKFEKEIFSESKEIITIKPLNIESNSKNTIIKFEIQEAEQYQFFEIKNKFYFEITNNIKLYRSELISNKGTFNEIKITSDLLYPNFTIDFFDIYNTKFFSYNTSLEDFFNLINNEIQVIVILPNQKTLSIINKSYEIEKFNILNYLFNGLKLNLGIAIDFTRSNGNPNELDSLHNITKETPNNYEKIILSLGKIFTEYNPEKKFPVFGFGALIAETSNYCFNINFNLDPNIYTIENVIKEYHNCLNKIILSGPTNVYPVLKRFIYQVKEENLQWKYNTLLLLTDGLFDDVNEIIDILIESSYYNVSIIIIGIGDEDFKQMKFINESFPIFSRNNQKRNRNNILFINFSEFENKQNKLYDNIMEFIYKDILNYYTSKKIFPSQIKH